MGWLGKKPSNCLVSREVPASAVVAMGESKATRLLGVEDQVGENPCDEIPISQLEVAVEPEVFEWNDQGKGSDSPASKELNFVWDVKGIAGLSCDGQERKLKHVLGKLVANKHGKGAVSSAGYDAESNLRLGDDCIFY